MRKVAVVTDSNSGIRQDMAASLGVHVIPMPFIMDGEPFFEDINLTHETFYKKLNAGADISTSQPSPGAVTELWNRLLAEHDEIVHIPMSSSLSASCGSAIMLAEDYGGKVQVVDNQRISVTQAQSATDAVKLAGAGWNALEIKGYLEKVKLDTSIYITLDTLKYLKKGGRVTPAAAAIGTILNIKPVLQIQGEKLDSYAKARGAKQGRKLMIEAIRHDLDKRFTEFSSPGRMHLYLVCSDDPGAGLDFKNEVEAAFPRYGVEMGTLSLSVACHIGPGALALACSRKLDCL